MPYTFQLKTLVQDKPQETGKGLWHNKLFFRNIILLFLLQGFVYWNSESKLVLNTSLPRIGHLDNIFLFFLNIVNHQRTYIYIYFHFQIVFSQGVAVLANGRNLVLNWTLPWSIDLLHRVQVWGEFILFSSSLEQSEKEESPDRYPTSPPRFCNQTKNPACRLGWFPGWIEIGYNGFWLPIHLLSAEY